MSSDVASANADGSRHKSMGVDDGRILDETRMAGWLTKGFVVL